MLNDNILDIVPYYMYHWLLLTEFFNYNHMIKAVAKSASRSLGLVIASCKVNGGFEYSTFSKLFDILIMSVIEDCVSIWESKEFSCINAVKIKQCGVCGCRKIYAKFSYFEWHGLEAMYCITMVMYFFFF
jgi:hypothetical protein